jgi:hypothetical protein
MQNEEGRMKIEKHRTSRIGGAEPRSSAKEGRRAEDSDALPELEDEGRGRARLMRFAFWAVRGNSNLIICEHDYD